MWAAYWPVIKFRSSVLWWTNETETWCNSSWLLKSFRNLVVSFKRLPLKQLRYRYCILSYSQEQERALFKKFLHLEVDMNSSHPLAAFTCIENGLISFETSLYTFKLKIVELYIMQILNWITWHPLRKKND